MLIDLYEAASVALPATPPVRAVGAVPFDEFVAELLELYHPSLRSPGTRRQLHHTIKVLKELGVESTADLTVTLLARIVATRDPNLSPNTVRSLLRSVHVVCNHAYKCVLVAINPFLIRPLRTWTRPCAPRGVSHLTREQVRKILDLLRRDSEERRGWAQWRARRTEAVFCVAAFTGLRKGELLFLQVQDVDMAERVVYVADRGHQGGHRLKTEGSEAPVPIPPPLVERLADWMRHIDDAPPGFKRPSSPWLFPNVQAPTPWTAGPAAAKPLARIQAVAKRAGVDYVSFKLLRRSLATHLEFFGAGPAMIQRILRHTNVHTSIRHYRKADIENMRRTVEDFTY